MMREEDRKRIKQLLGEIECPKGFRCTASGFRYICKAKAGNGPCETRCLEEDPEKCVFSKPDGDGFECECPLRRYIREKLGL